MKIAKILIILFILMTLTSCWDMREINELALVMAVAVDKADNSNNYIITVQIANPKGQSESSSGTSALSEPFVVLTSEGKTLFDATRDLVKVSSRRIMWAHNNIIIIGESLAKEGILPVIDYFTHNPELRMKTSVVVAKGNARDYIASKVGQSEIAGVSLSEIYKHSNYSAEYLETDLLEVCRDYYSQYSQPVLSVISYKKDKYIPKDGQVNTPIDTIVFGGVAVFNKDKMAGMLSTDETIGSSWILNQAGNTIVSVEEPGQSGRSVSVETENIKSSVITNVENGKPSIEIKISGKGRIVEEDGTTNLTIDEFKKEIETLVDARIVGDINLSLDKVQKEFKCDIYEWAHIFHAQHNDDWEKELKYNWQSIFPTIPVSIEANIDIYSSTLFQVPMSEPNKAGE